MDIFVELPNISPMVVGIGCGNSKPVLNEYIEPLVSELEFILPTGIFIKGHHVEIEFGRVECDTPARCQMKGIYLLSYNYGILML